MHRKNGHSLSMGGKYALPVSSTGKQDPWPDVPPSTTSAASSHQEPSIATAPSRHSVRNKPHTPATSSNSQVSGTVADTYASPGDRRIGAVSMPISEPGRTRPTCTLIVDIQVVCNLSTDASVPQVAMRSRWDDPIAQRSEWGRVSEATRSWMNATLQWAAQDFAGSLGLPWSSLSNDCKLKLYTGALSARAAQIRKSYHEFLSEQWSRVQKQSEVAGDSVVDAASEILILAPRVVQPNVNLDMLDMGSG